MFDKMKQLLDMQKKLQEVKYNLENTNFKMASSDGLVKITMSASQEVKEVIIQRPIEQIDKATLEKALKDAYNRAIRHSQEMTQQKMKEVTGFDLGGLL
jgi:DNA-binding YbaB/EbfC family protein